MVGVIIVVAYIIICCYLGGILKALKDIKNILERGGKVEDE